MGRADIVVIGGGLAGSSCALELARHGACVTLIERTTTRTMKVCGDFLSGEALDRLAYLGIYAGRLGAAPIHRLALSDGAKTANVTLPFRAAGLSRTNLDEALLGKAATHGVTVVRGVSVSGLHTDGKQASISAGRRTYRGDAAVLATGKHNLRGWQRPPGTATAFKMQFTLGPAARRRLTGKVGLFFYNGGHIGACLVDGGDATVCWQIDTKSLSDFGSTWRHQMAEIAHRCPAFDGLLDGARPLQTRPTAVSNLPFGFVRQEQTPDNVYSIGDQMAVIPSFTGDGTAIALGSGIQAARAILAGKSAGLFVAEFAGRIRRQFAFASGISAVMRSPLGRAVGIATVRTLPSLVTLLARATRHANLAIDQAPGDSFGATDRAR